MKKIVFLFLIFLQAAVNQAQSFDEKQSMFSVGYGIGSYHAIIFDANTSTSSAQQVFLKNKSTTIGPIYFKYQYMMDENISIGLNLAYINMYKDVTYQTNKNGIDTVISDSRKFNSYSVLARVNYHNSPDEAFDLYGGVSVGYRFARTTEYDGFTNTTNTYGPLSNFPIGFEAIIGARYLITENIGIYGEFGLAKSVIQFGLSYKM
ncbi:MAG: outer membrane beta-barrel protein [Bacteroidetes bacterium]|nr:outer membrane beta-barrel protein [Bacteroidota bacterium]